MFIVSAKKKELDFFFFVFLANLRQFSSSVTVKICAFGVAWGIGGNHMEKPSLEVTSRFHFPSCWRRNVFEKQYI